MYIPASTYRIQLHRGFNFSQLLDLLPYLYDLGITTIYASPVTRAVKGSEHGYDVCNPRELNPELGSLDDWQKINDFLKDHSMGWIQDIVPNHMAFSTENEIICDLLERGEYADQSEFPDIIPQFAGAIVPGRPATRIMVPFLEKDLKDMVQEGGLKLVLRSTGFFFETGEQIYPVTVATYPWICSFRPEFFQPLLAWSEKIFSFSQLPRPTWLFFKRLLMTEVFGDERLRARAISQVDLINKDPAMLMELLSLQAYELCGWKTSLEKMNYRRFFAVNSLICLRMEDEVVFRYWHQWLLDLVARGFIQGFRVDHVDGLFDPGGYLQQLRTAAGPGLYLVWEKILQENETTDPSWPGQGTTGYDFLGMVNQLFIDQQGRAKLREYFKTQISGDGYADLVFKRKWQFLQFYLRGEWKNLMRWLEPFMSKTDHPDPGSIREALGVLMASLPVYRLYVRRLPMNETDRKWIEQAFQGAYERAPLLHAALDWLKSLFYGNSYGDPDATALYFLQRWSQYTAPLAAKGTEDTVFYQYNELVGLNEVGDSPGRAPVTAKEFHRLMQERLQREPLSMNSSSTHDTKRGEDNRLRINLISLYAEEWIRLAGTWEKTNESFVKTRNNRRSPSRNHEYLIYQALTGALPAAAVPDRDFRKRFSAYLTKALREGDQETHWHAPDLEYEQDCHDFADRILSPEHDFLSSFLPFVQKIIERAEVYALSETLLKLTAPGIPDIYQGAELWDLSLVDPDNRRPVDYQRRRDMLNTMLEKEKQAAPMADILQYIFANRCSGAQKLWLIRQLLTFRKSQADLFDQGEYIPLPASRECIAYLRRYHEHQLLVLAPLPSLSGLTTVSGIADIHGRWRNLLTGEMLDLEDSLDCPALLHSFPVAALVRS